MKISLCTVSLLFLTITLSAQKTFEKSYDKYFSAVAYTVFVQDDGYLMVMMGLKDEYILAFVKTNLDGDTLWSKEYDLNFSRESSLVGSSDVEGNIYIGCQYGDLNLMKFNEDAEMIWGKYYGSFKKEMVVKDNILWVCDDVFPGHYLYKIDANNGDSIWRSELFHADIIQSSCTSLAITDNNDVIVTVSYRNYYLEKSDFYKLSGSTNQLVEFTLPTNANFVICDTKCIGNEIISIGNDADQSINQTRTYMIRYDAEGNLINLREENFAKDFRYVNFYKFIINSENQVVMEGEGMLHENYGKKILYCMSISGDSLWTQLLGDTYTDIWDIKMANDNGYVLSGYVPFAWETVKPYLIKTNSMGMLNTLPEKTNNAEILAIPNPASDQVTFKTNGINSGTIIISNLSGEICSEIPISGNSTVWNCQRFKPGLYFYSIISHKVKNVGFIIVSH